MCSSDLDGRGPGAAVTVALRPEAVSLGLNGSGLPGTVESVAFLGAVVRTRVKLDRQTITLDSFHQSSSRPPEPGAPVRLTFGAGDLLVLGED